MEPPVFGPKWRKTNMYRRTLRALAPERRARFFADVFRDRGDDASVHELGFCVYKSIYLSAGKFDFKLNGAQCCQDEFNQTIYPEMRDEAARSRIAKLASDVRRQFVKSFFNRRVIPGVLAEARGFLGLSDAEASVAGVGPCSVEQAICEVVEGREAVFPPRDKEIGLHEICWRAFRFVCSRTGVWRDNVQTLANEFNSAHWPKIKESRRASFPNEKFGPRLLEDSEFAEMKNWVSGQLRRAMEGLVVEESSFVAPPLSVDHPPGRSRGSQIERQQSNGAGATGTCEISGPRQCAGDTADNCESAERSPVNRADRVSVTTPGDFGGAPSDSGGQGSLSAVLGDCGGQGSANEARAIVGEGADSGAPEDGDMDLLEASPGEGDLDMYPNLGLEARRLFPGGVSFEGLPAALGEHLKKLDASMGALLAAQTKAAMWRNPTPTTGRSRKEYNVGAICESVIRSASALSDSSLDLVGRASIEGCLREEARRATASNRAQTNRELNAVRHGRAVLFPSMETAAAETTDDLSRTEVFFSPCPRDVGDDVENPPERVGPFEFRRLQLFKDFLSEVVAATVSEARRFFAYTLGDTKLLEDLAMVLPVMGVYDHASGRGTIGTYAEAGWWLPEVIEKFQSGGEEGERCATGTKSDKTTEEAKVQAPRTRSTQARFGPIPITRRDDVGAKLLAFLDDYVRRRSQVGTYDPSRLVTHCQVLTAHLRPMALAANDFLREEFPSINVEIKKDGLRNAFLPSRTGSNTRTNRQARGDLAIGIARFRKDYVRPHVRGRYATHNVSMQEDHARTAVANGSIVRFYSIDECSKIPTLVAARNPTRLQAGFASRRDGVGTVSTLDHSFVYGDRMLLCIAGVVESEFTGDNQDSSCRRTPGLALKPARMHAFLRSFRYNPPSISAHIHDLDEVISGAGDANAIIVTCDNGGDYCPGSAIFCHMAYRIWRKSKVGHFQVVANAPGNSSKNWRIELQWGSIRNRLTMVHLGRKELRNEDGPLSENDIRRITNCSLAELQHHCNMCFVNNCDANEPWSTQVRHAEDTAGAGFAKEEALLRRYYTASQKALFRDEFRWIRQEVVDLRKHLKKRPGDIAFSRCTDSSCDGCATIWKGGRDYFDVVPGDSCYRPVYKSEEIQGARVAAGRPSLRKDHQGDQSLEMRKWSELVDSQYHQAHETIPVGPAEILGECEADPSCNVWHHSEADRLRHARCHHFLSRKGIPMEVETDRGDKRKRERPIAEPPFEYHSIPDFVGSAEPVNKKRRAPRPTKSGLPRCPRNFNVQSVKLDLGDFEDATGTVTWVPKRQLFQSARSLTAMGVSKPRTGGVAKGQRKSVKLEIKLPKRCALFSRCDHPKHIFFIQRARTRALQFLGAPQPAAVPDELAPCPRDETRVDASSAPLEDSHRGFSDDDDVDMMCAGETDLDDMRSEET